MKIEAAELRQKVTRLNHSDDFNALALEIFRYQREFNPIYCRFLQLTGKANTEPRNWTEIPCLPVSFFKTHTLYCGKTLPETVYSSSGTSGSENSRHYVSDPLFYLNLAKKIFESNYGPLAELTLLALLPGYMERTGSSLIAMISHFMNFSKKGSGFFLHQHEELAGKMQELHAKKERFVLIGVTHALLDFSENHRLSLPRAIIMETGGMKGKRKEITRTQVHEQLCAAFGVTSIHSEYGMTEMLSQAYSKGDGIFECPPSMNIRIRDISDPFCFLENGKTGAVNIFDLANVDSVAFIAIDDLGKKHGDKKFEILGRLDNSDVRGCNLLVQ